ncbi:acyl-CoA dehydrogenase family protein [Nocardia sp. CA2R105]|uniref:acyl-CoA dehydrogenase family protein n=1 Tax=Nocardia coffeae TaxID=2873381 RepID=UPI001CA75CE4|nr:acyl-CoA dehydrogenase family protein [Nocardia coffeae]MBY8863580.1 acyl-CoA dehydrogenase family protein [Nocardia coffeae]
MRLRLDSELEDLRATVDNHAKRTVGPLAEKVDRTQSFSRELWAAVREIGLTRLPFAEEHGGDGGTVRAYVVATREVARHCPVAALYPGTSIQVAMTLLDHGTPEQIAQYVPGLVAGDVIASWAFTEPGTGSDPRQIVTRAEPNGSGWRLTGAKQFISFAAQATVALVFARTSETTLGAFLVDTSASGWEVGPPSEVLSMGGTEARPVTLDAVRVPHDGLVGTAEDGFGVMIAGEAFGKVRAATISVGIAARALEEASAYALTRGHRGTPIGRKFPTIQALLGRAAASTLSAESLVLTCADLLDRHLPVPAEAASARLVAGRAAKEASAAALHVCGAYGLTREMIVERLYREAVFFDVSQGVSEIQQIIVARELLADATRGGKSQ